MVTNGGRRMIEKVSSMETPVMLKNVWLMFKVIMSERKGIFYRADGVRP
jgi:hypothetical protein